MSSNRALAVPEDKNNTLASIRHRRDTNGSGNSSNKGRGTYCGGQGIVSDDSITEDEDTVGGPNMMEEIEKVFKKAFDAKFGKIERRLLAMEEKSDKVHKLISQRGVDFNEDVKYLGRSDESFSPKNESMYRDLVDLMENNTEETKNTSKQLEKLNAKQSDLIKNTQELMEKTTRLQKMVKTLQNKSFTPMTGTQQRQDKIHSDDQQDRLSSASKEEPLHNQNLYHATKIEEPDQGIDRLNTIVENVCEQLDTWVKYSDENTNRMLEKLTSMAHAVEATTVQGKVLHDNMTKRIDSIGTNLEKRLGGLEKIGIDMEIVKGANESVFEAANNIESTMNKVVVPLLNDTFNMQKETLGEGRKFKEAIEKINISVNNTPSSNDVDISNEQNLENLSNIMESLTRLTQDTSGIKTGINDILNYKLTEDFLQGMCQMMIDSKTMLETFADKKSLSSLNNSVHDIKLSEVKINMQLKEIKSVCSTLSRDTTVKELADQIKGSHVKQHVDVAADIKKFESERFDEIKQTLQKLQKAQSKAGGKQPIDKASKKKTDDNHGSSDEASVHSMLLQMEIKKASAEQTKLLNKMETKMQELVEKQIGHYSWLDDFKKDVDSGFGSLSKKLVPQDRPQEYDFSKFEHTLKSCMSGHTNTILEDFKKYANIQTEILNSIEDIKLLTSSIPNSVNDLVPIIEKTMADIDSFPDNINGCFAGLEENLCANLEGRVKHITNGNLKELCDRFDTIEQRLLVIRKYVKHGPGSTKDTHSDHGGDVARDDNKENALHQNNAKFDVLLEKIDLVFNAVERCLETDADLHKDIAQIGKNLVCFNDLKSDISEEKIKHLAVEVSRQMSSSFKDDLDLPLTTIRDVQYQILGQQAKADVVEEQFLALADEIMPRIKELKAIEDNLITFCQNSLEPMFENLKNSATNTGERTSLDDVSTMFHNQFDDVLSSLNQLEDKLGTNQSVILANLRSLSEFNIKETQKFNENKKNVRAINMETKGIEMDRKSKFSIKQPSSSIGQLKDLMPESSVATLTQNSKLPCVRLKRQAIPDNHSSPLNTKDSRRKGSDRNVNTPPRHRKRSLSPSTDDSIIDTNSEAPDQSVEIVAEPFNSKPVMMGKKSSTSKINQWEAKRRRPGCSKDEEKISDESEIEEFPHPKNAKQYTLNNWRTKPGDKEFDLASIMSEDVYPQSVIMD